jgi:hypothetical protein
MVKTQYISALTKDDVENKRLFDLLDLRTYENDIEWTTQSEN